VMQCADDNPYEAPQAESGAQNARKANPSRSIVMSIVCACLAPLWTVLVIAAVMPSTTPSTARILFLIIGEIPAIFLVWLAIKFGKR
jgi:hypothetical protein